MSEKSNGNSPGGIGLMGVLFIVFLVLKLCDVIQWSWWWVTAPLWGPVCLALAFCVACLIFAGFCWVMAAVLERKVR